jgi:hypothetical protein
MTKDLFRSRSGIGTNVDAEKTKTEKRGQANKKKVTYFVRTVVVAVSTLKQITIGFRAWSGKYGSVKDMTMRFL